MMMNHPLQSTLSHSPLSFSSPLLLYHAFSALHCPSPTSPWFYWQYIYVPIRLYKPGKWSGPLSLIIVHCLPVHALCSMNKVCNTNQAVSTHSYPIRLVSSNERKAVACTYFVHAGYQYFTILNAMKSRHVSRPSGMAHDHYHDSALNEGFIQNDTTPML